MTETADRRGRVQDRAGGRDAGADSVLPSANASYRADLFRSWLYPEAFFGVGLGVALVFLDFYALAPLGWTNLEVAILNVGSLAAASYLAWQVLGVVPRRIVLSDDGIALYFRWVW